MNKYEYFSTLDACKQPIRIAHQFTEDGKRRYIGFDTYVDVRDYVRNNPNLSLHEVTRCGNDGIQRIFIDIDAKRDDFKDISVSSINTAGNLLVTTAKEILHYRGITNVDLFELVSHRPDKYSKHIVFVSAYIDAKHYECFYNELVTGFALNLELLNLPTELTGMIDKKVYEKHHNLRLHTSFKFGSHVRLQKRDPNTGIIENDGKFDVETLVTYIPIDQSNQNNQLIQIYKCDIGCNGPTKQPQVIVGDDHIKMAELILEAEQLEVLKQNGSYFRLSIDHSKPCPVCGDIHDSENAFAVVSSRDVKIICRRKNKGDPNRFRILYKFGRYIEDIPKLITDIKSLSIKYTQSDFLSPIDETMEECDRLFIRSDMNSAKSSRLHAYIANQIRENPNFTCVILTYRINLAANIFSATKKVKPEGSAPFEKYSDITEPCIRLSRHNKLIIQLESLHRIIYDLKDQIDLVVIDEAVSFCQQNVSGLNKANIAINQMMLRGILKGSKKTVILDALLDTPTIEAYTLLLPNDKHVLWDNKLNNLWAPDIELFNDVVKWRRQISDDLKRGEKIYVSTTNGEVPIKQLDRYLTKLNPDINSLLIYGGKDNTEIISNINEELVNYDLVIASPCMSAGISFDVKNYFDKVYVYIDNHGPTAIDIIQSVRRVRHIKTNNLIICNASGKLQLPTNYDDIFRVEQERLKFNSRDYVNDGFNVDIEVDKIYFSNPVTVSLKWWFHCMRIVNLNSIDKFGTVMNYLKSKGAIVSKIIEKDVKNDDVKWDRSSFKADGVDIKRSLSEEIADARIVSEAEYEEMRSNGRYYTRINHDIPFDIACMQMTESKSILMKKFQLLKFYGLHEDLFPEDNKKIRTNPFNRADFVELYSKDAVKECYQGMAYRNLSDEKITEIDNKTTMNMSDEEKTKHRFLLGRHVTINKIKSLFASGNADYEPVINFIKELGKANNPLVRVNCVTNKNIKSVANKIVKQYGYKISVKRIGKTRTRILQLRDYSSDLFIVKNVPYGSIEAEISAVLQSGDTEMPIVVVYTE